MLNIQQILGDKYMEKFKIYHEQTLFPPDWNMLKENRCPLCFNLLHFPLKGNVVYCKSNKHRKQFVISEEKLRKLKI